ncbi:MAG: proton-conducting transporter membrane subunit, partial [Candidatus Binatia bacterium]
MELPAIHWLPLLPLLIVTAAAVGVLLVDLFLEGPEGDTLAWLSVLGLGLAGGASALLWGGEADTLGSSLVLDNYALFFNLLFCVAMILTVFMSVDYLQTTAVRAGEYYSLALFATAGMMTMAAAKDLIVVFLGLEIMSIAVYVLAGIWREEARSNEAALKYFL